MWVDGQAGGGATKYSILNRWTYETLPKNCPFDWILNTQLSSQINKIKIPNHFRAGWAMIGLEQIITASKWAFIYELRLAKPNHSWHCTRQAFRLELKIADISFGLDMYWSPVLPSPSQVQHWLCSSQINKIKIPNHFRAGWKWSDSSLSVI